MAAQQHTENQASQNMVTQRSQKKDLKNTPYVLVAAMDFGTTFSGYAFSSRFDYKRSPLNVNTLVWSAGSGNLASLKTSTCILFKPDETFDSFGYDAEDKYAKLIDEGNHRDWFFFKRFKMSLYKIKAISRSMTLQAQNKKSMLAMKVFSASIQFLKDHLLQTCKTKGFDLMMSDIRWVLTMPAIWSDRAKQFMRECAQQAGIPGHQLIMALEAEAAALFCKYLPLKDMSVGEEGHNVSVFRPGARYMVLDVGGGTVDITVHEVQDGMKLKEIHMANGGDWGGTMVDQEFETFLTELLGTKAFESFKDNNVADYLELQRSFEAKKRTLSESKESKITFTLPISLLDTFKMHHPKGNIVEIIGNNKKFANNLTWKMDKVRMSSGLAQTLFRPSVQKIIDHVLDLLHVPEVDKIQAILLVGGYSERPLLQKEISVKFPEKRLIVPNEAGLAVLKGAVINGHELDAITERISRFTYGICTSEEFIEGLHPEKFLFYTSYGEARCRNTFSCYVRIGEKLPVGIEMAPQTYYPTEPDQESVAIDIYITSDPFPIFTTDPGCECVGSIEVVMPDTSKGLNRAVQVVFTFGGAEIEVKAYDIDTSEEKQVYFDFLA